MMRNTLLQGALALGMATSAFTANAATSAPQKLSVPPLAFEDTHITVVWDKPASGTATGYHIYVNGSLKGTVSKISWPSGLTNQQLYFDVTGLSPSTSYKLTVRAVDASGAESVDSNAVTQSTTATPAVINVTASPYNAKGDGSTLNTKAIQNAINACATGGKVLIPSGTFKSGALYVKSNCTLQIDGKLQGSGSKSDYESGNNRFAQYGTSGFGSVAYKNNYKGLLNSCGHYSDWSARTGYSADNLCSNVTNVRITGAGSVVGVAALASAMGTDARSDLVNLTGINGLYIANLKFDQSAEHMLYIGRSSNITVANVNVQSKGISNGDGIDLTTAYAKSLSSSGPSGLLPTNAWIFGSTWNNGDDCINLNAGTGAPGVTTATPVNGVHVFNNNTLAGHGGVVWGSYTAAGFKNIFVTENTFDGTDVGLRFKTGSGHGGGIATLGSGDIGALAVDNVVRSVGTGIVITNQYADTTGMPPAAMGVFHDITIKGLTGSATKAIAIDTGTKLNITSSVSGTVSISGVTSSTINGKTY